MKCSDVMAGIFERSLLRFFRLASHMGNSREKISRTEKSITIDDQVSERLKVELVYEYLTGSRFRHRIEAIVEKFSEMQKDLEQERRAMTRLWAKGQAQIEGTIESSAGMYGDLQGIAGQEIQEIEGLELTALESAMNETPVFSEDDQLENLNR